jgi:hypothetical protein
MLKDRMADPSRGSRCHSGGYVRGVACATRQSYHRDGDHEDGVICRKSSTGEKEVKECGYDSTHRTSC